jgi:hypothetical protein
MSRTQHPSASLGCTRFRSIDLKSEYAHVSRGERLKTTATNRGTRHNKQPFWVVRFTCILQQSESGKSKKDKPMSDPMSNNIQDTARKLPIVPHHEVSEAFADQVGAIFFDGSILKIDFVAVRLSAAQPPAPSSGERHVVARLVLSPAGTVDLINQVKKLADQMTQAGLIKAEQPLAKPN